VITSPATIELPLRRTLVHSELYSALSNIFKFSNFQLSGAQN